MLVGDTSSPVSQNGGNLGINGGSASSNRAQGEISGGLQALSKHNYSSSTWTETGVSGSGEPRRRRVRSALKGRRGEPQNFVWNSRALSWWFQREWKIEPKSFKFTQPSLLMHACTFLPTDIIRYVEGYLHRMHYWSRLDDDYFWHATETCTQVVKWRRTCLNGSHGEWTESDDVENSVKKRASNKKKFSVNPGRGKFGSNTAPESRKSGIDAGLRQLEGCVGSLSEAAPVSHTKCATPAPVPHKSTRKGPAGGSPKMGLPRVVEEPTAPLAADMPWCDDTKSVDVVVDHGEPVPAAVDNALELELRSESRLLAIAGPPPIITGARLGKFQLGNLTSFLATHGALARGLYNVGYRPLQGPLKRDGLPVEHIHVPPVTPLLVDAIIPSTRPVKVETFYDKCWRWSLRVRSLVGYPLFVLGCRSDWLCQLMGYSRSLSSGFVLDPRQEHHPLGESDDMTRLIGYTSAYVAQVDPVIEQHLVSSFSKSTSVDVYCMARMRAVAIDLYHDLHAGSSLADDVLANTVARAAARLKVIIAHSVSHQGGTADRVMMKQW